MALKTLKGVTSIGGYPAINMTTLKETHPLLFPNGGDQMDYKVFERDFRPKYYIFIRDDVNSISFTIQSGPNKENGENGCQLDTLVETAVMMIENLNVDHPSYENEQAVIKFREGLMWLRERTRNRVIRGVEGTNKV
jgi:hypothetical protein